MSLDAGFNLVTGRVETTNEELPALAFFRRLAEDQSVPSRITVTGLEQLLSHVDEDDIDSVVRELRDVLRRTNSFSGPKAVQLVFEGI